MRSANQHCQGLKERMELAFAGYKAGSWEWNLQTDEAFYSKEWYTLLGYEGEDTYADLSVWSNLVHPDDLERVLNDVDKALEKKAFSVEAVHRLKAADGSWLWVLGRGAIEYENDGTPLRMVGIHTDITQQKKQELKIKQQAKIIEQVPDAIILISLEGKILSWNQGATTLFHYTEEEIAGKELSLLVKDDIREDFKNYLSKIVQNFDQNLNIHSEMTFIQKNGKEVEVGLSFSLLKDEDASVNAIVIYGQDITQRVSIYKKLLLQKDQLNKQAHHDTLTGLPNRIYFQKKLQESIADLDFDEKLALFFIDLDDFKQINDTYGHSIGDKVLQETANRLKKSVRTSDFVARLSGDEFIIILKEIKSITDIEKIAKNILAILPKEFIVEDQNIVLGCSIGIALYPDDTNSSEKLFVYADSAMYEAKKSGKNIFKLYNLMI